MNVPFGRVLRLQYRDLNPKMAADTSALVIHFRGPDGDMYEHPLPNERYLVDNAALQFMALNGIKPSDFEGTSWDVTDLPLTVPLAYTDDGYALNQMALSGGRACLSNTEWFSASDDEESAESDESGPHGGGGPDPGTGNRAGVDNDTEEPVKVEMAGDDSNAGLVFEI